MRLAWYSMDIGLLLYRNAIALLLCSSIGAVATTADAAVSVVDVGGVPRLAITP